MTFRDADLPAPFDSDHALHVVGRIGVVSARLELCLAMMRWLIDDDETRPVTTLVMLRNEDNARAIRRAVDARQWRATDDLWDVALGVHDRGVPLRGRITDWTHIAAGLLQERSDLMHSPWLQNEMGGLGDIGAGRLQTGDRQPVTIPALEHLSCRIEEACEQFPILCVYVRLHSGPRNDVQPGTAHA